MNRIIKVVFRRISGCIAHPGRQFHNGVSKIETCGPKPNVVDNDRIVSLVQKTIIPLNRVVPKPAILDKPDFNIIRKIDASLPEKIDIEPTKEIQDPVNKQEKKAHTMLIIRRKKMNKHKYKKYRKKHRAAIQKLERERSMKRETTFRQEIHAKLKEAQKFNAEEYVAEKLEMYRRKVLTNRIHGVIMPEFAVKEFLERRQRKREMLEAKAERRKKLIAERGSLLVDPPKQL